MKLTIEKINGLYLVDFQERGTGHADDRRIFTKEELAYALCRWDSDVADAIGPIKAEIDKQLAEWRSNMRKSVLTEATE